MGELQHKGSLICIQSIQQNDVNQMADPEGGRPVIFDTPFNINNDLLLSTKSGITAICEYLSTVLHNIVYSQQSII